MTNNQMQDVIQFSIAQLHIASQRVQSRDRLAAVHAIDAATTPLQGVYDELSGAKPPAPEGARHYEPEQPTLYSEVAQ
jgi:hypothetical protein